ncbi:LolA family protein [Paludifilum halophilum]|uniref:Uncharacterized protein n=1 Tax=Paludifilum halophilum TaxID=1642702 RepID=A0A235B963_9BACL|nr:hypothetical protein [Paludifilum halophilum]OYD08772.1 hypothetical protein CHM34_02960 [Paludifilum halophilum]
MGRLKKTFVGVIAAVISVGFGAPSAFAETYYCDNDRAYDQYPNCSNSYSGTWTYRSGQSGDWNGDDRLGAYGNGYYDWKFYNIPGDGARLYAWLNNIDFTNQSAEYSVDTDVIGYINQNTAPGGWNSPGSHYISGNPFFQVDNYDWSGNSNTRTGADIIRIETYYYNAANSTETRQPVKAKDSDIAEIQNKMLNAVDHYKDIQGSFEMQFSNINDKKEVEFTLSEENPGSYVKVTKKGGNEVVRKSNGKSILKLNPQQKAYSKTSVSPSSPIENPRHYKNEKGQNVFVHRQDPAWARTANEVTLPQNYAFWLTANESEVVGYDTLLNRKVAVIKGKHDSYLQKKLGADTFKMWVDRQTGVLLKLEGTDSKGNVAYSIDVQDIQFNQGVNESQFTVDTPKGWEKVEKPSNR